MNAKTQLPTERIKVLTQRICYYYVQTIL